MISRRDYLKLCLATGVTLSLKSAPSWAAGQAGAPNADRKLELITRAIPSSGERLPAVGLGSSATFAVYSSWYSSYGLSSTTPRASLLPNKAMASLVASSRSRKETMLP